MQRWILTPFLLLPALLLALVAVVSQAEAQGQNQVANGFARDIEHWDAALQGVEGALETGIDTQQSAEDLRRHVLQTTAQMSEMQEAVTSQLQPLQRQLDALGPAPDDPTAEAPEVQTRRAQLVRDIQLYQSRLQQLQLLKARADEALRGLTRASQILVREHLLRKGPSPFSIAVWEQAFNDLWLITVAQFDAPYQWWEEARPARVGWGPYFWSLTGGLFTFFLTLTFRRWLASRYGRVPGLQNPSYVRAVLATAVEGLTRGLIPVLVWVVIVSILDATGLLPPVVQAASRGLLAGVAFFFIIGALAHAALSPQDPDWRIVPLSRDVSRRLGKLLGLLITWVAVVVGVGVATEPYRPVSFETTAVLSFLVTSTTTLLILPLLGHWFWIDFAGREHKPSLEDEKRALDAEETEQKPERILPWYIQLIRLGLLLFLIAIPLSALMGFANLANYLSQSLINSGVVVGLGLMLRTMLHEAVTSNLVATAGPARVGQVLGLTLDGAKRLSYWIGLLLDMLLLFFGLLLLLISWGVPRNVIHLWVRQFLEGLTIGGITFAPGEIFFAIVLFILVLSFARFFQRFLSRRILPRTRLDSGVRHSLSAAANYTGIALALLISISALGLDLSNLAIIAGALSVGIGFGLQTVVNNFVSGLILLIERPVKVGDWISVGGFEGWVRKISVRSTEIETFDRSEVILPNSELIASPVVNWTHKTRVARIHIRIGVAYGSNTGLVRELLTQAAQENPNIHKSMPIQVIFRDFGDSSLDFELRCFVVDTDFYLSAQSEIRFRIDELFRENGVEIPFPQRDLHIKDLDRVLQVLGRQESFPENHSGHSPQTIVRKDKGDPQ